MKVLPKFLKIAVIVLAAILVLLFSASLIMQNRVGDIILKSLNRNFITRIETGSYRLSLIRKFPNASLELKNVLVHSSPTFDVTSFRNISTDTLLAAKSAFIICRMADLLRGAFTFTRIDVKSGFLNVFTDSVGGYNYQFTKSGSSSEGSNVMLNLNRINLSEVKFAYNDLRVDLVVKGIFNDGRFKSRIKGSNIEFEGNSATEFNLFSLGSTVIKYRVPAKVDVSLNKTEKGIFFRKNTMTVENWDFVLTGLVASDNYLDLNVTGNNIDLSRVVNLFPDKYRDKASDFHPSGILKLDSKIKGYATERENPHYDVIFSLKNARIDNRRSSFKLDRLSFDGSLTNGAKNRPETSLFLLSNFTTRLGSSEFMGSFSMANFSKPKAELSLKGSLLPSEISDFLNLESVASATGSIDLDLNFSGYPDVRNGFRISDLLDMNSHSELAFKSFGLKLNNRNIDFSDVNGDVSIQENTVTDNFRFTFNGQKIRLTGKFANFPGWIAGNPVTLSGSGTLYASIIRPELFMNNTPDKDKTDKTLNTRAPLKLPSDVNLDLDFSLDSLIYKTFDARKISGSLGVRSKMLNFRTINLNSQKGKISGNMLVAQHPDNTFTGRGTFELTGVDVNEAFTTFHNFGQGFLKAENIAGSLSGSISLILPVDSLLKPVMSRLTAEGKYVLTDGALIDFDPVKALSSFISLSELENIKFSQLENDFFIRNSTFYVPTMDVSSSAVDLSVNGKHSFENDYEYHVKMRLSEILSNKARKNRTLSDEFGEIEDDGLGRTSVLLRIVGRGEDVKVSYDMEAARNQIKSEFLKEKQNLKTILNEEYGGRSKSPEAEKKKFRVSWEGSETKNPAAEEAPPVKKESIIKRIFRKK